MARTGVPAEPKANPGAKKPSELTCFRASRSSLHTHLCPVVALGLSGGRGQVWVRQLLGRFSAVGQQQTTALAAWGMSTQVVEGVLGG